MSGGSGDNSNRSSGLFFGFSYKGKENNPLEKARSPIESYPSPLQLLSNNPFLEADLETNSSKQLQEKLKKLLGVANTKLVDIGINGIDFEQAESLRADLKEIRTLFKSISDIVERKLTTVTNSNRNINKNLASELLSTQQLGKGIVLDSTALINGHLDKVERRITKALEKKSSGLKPKP